MIVSRTKIRKNASFLNRTFLLTLGTLEELSRIHDCESGHRKLRVPDHTVVPFESVTVEEQCTKSVHTSHSEHIHKSLGYVEKSRFGETPALEFTCGGLCSQFRLVSGDETRL